MIEKDFSKIWREPEVCDTKRDLSAMASTGARQRCGTQNPGQKNNNGNSRG